MILPGQEDESNEELYNNNFPDFFHSIFFFIMADRLLIPNFCFLYDASTYHNQSAFTVHLISTPHTE